MVMLVDYLNSANFAATAFFNTLNAIQSAGGAGSPRSWLPGWLPFVALTASERQELSRVDMILRPSRRLGPW